MLRLYSLVSSSSSSSQVFRRALTPPGPPPSPPSTLSSHMLRRKARSALVNSFRRHVLPTLSSNMTTGPFAYVAWIVRSILRQNEAKVEALIQEAGLGMTLYSSDGRDSPLSHHASKMTRTVSTGSKSLSDSPFFEDDEFGGGETSSTDTDGSSVHTPTDSLLHTTFPPSPLPIPKHKRIYQGVPRSPSPPSPPTSPTTTPSPKAISTLNTLSTLSNRLQILLGNLHQTHASMKSEEKQLLAVLEVKSRRRAWSNRDLLGGARVKDIGFGMPERGSSLSRCVVSSDEVELAFPSRSQATSVDPGVDALDQRFMSFEIGLGTGAGRREERKREMGTLFPVMEENEEESHVSETAQIPGDGVEECSLVGVPSDESRSLSVRLVDDAEKGCLLPLAIPRPTTPYPLQEIPVASSNSSPTVRTRTTSMLLRDHSQHPALELDIQLNVNVSMTVIDSEVPAPSTTNPILSPSSCTTPLSADAYSHCQTSVCNHSRSTSASSLSGDPYGPQTKIEIFDVGFCDEEDEDEYERDAPLTPSVHEQAFKPVPYTPSQPQIHSTPQHPWKDDLEGNLGEEFTLSMDVSPPGSPNHKPLPFTLPRPLAIPMPISKSSFQTSDDFGLPLPVSASRSKSRIGLGLGGRGRGRKVADASDGWLAGGEGVEVHR